MDKLPLEAQITVAKRLYLTDAGGNHELFEDHETLAATFSEPSPELVQRFIDQENAAIVDIPAEMRKQHKANLMVGAAVGAAIFGAVLITEGVSKIKDASITGVISGVGFEGLLELMFTNPVRMARKTSNKKAQQRISLLEDYLPRVVDGETTDIR